jgi:hypothetical protein
MAVAAAVAVLVVSGGAGTAWAAKSPPSNLKWVSAASVSDGVPADFSSVKPCPTTRVDGSPIQGTLEVFIQVSFTGGGAMTQGPFATNPDGSWSATATFNAGGFHDPTATVTASCQDVTFFGTIVGSYKAHDIVVNP